MHDYKLHALWVPLDPKIKFDEKKAYDYLKKYIGIEYAWQTAMFGTMDTIYENLPCRRGKVIFLFRIILMNREESVCSPRFLNLSLLTCSAHSPMLPSYVHPHWTRGLDLKVSLYGGFTKKLINKESAQQNSIPCLKRMITSMQPNGMETPKNQIFLCACPLLANF